MAESIITSVISLIITTIIGIIGYFLKQTITRVDKAEGKIEGMPERYVAVKTYNKDIGTITTEVKDIKNDIKAFQSGYLSKDDFIREMSQMNRKFELLEKKFDSSARRTDEKLDKVIANLNR